MQLRRTSNYLRKFWRVLTEPVGQTKSPEHRRQAQLLASLLTVIIAFAAILIVLGVAVPTTFARAPQDIFIELLAFAVLLPLYALSRTRFYKGAALTTLLVISSIIFVSAVPAGGGDQSGVLAYLIIPILLSSAFFPWEATAVFAFAITICTLAYPLAVPAVTEENILYGPFVLIVATSVINFIIGRHHNKVALERQAVVKDSEVRYRTLVDQASDGIAVMDTQGRWSEANPALCRRLGYKYEEFMALSVDDLIVEDDPTIRMLRSASEIQAKTIIREFSVKRKDGALIQMEVSLKRRPDGKIQGIFRDITERRISENALKESEARYRSLFENAPISLWEEDFSAVKAYIDDLRNSGVEDLRAYFQLHPGTAKYCASVVKVLDVNQASLDLYGASSEAEILAGLDKFFSEEGLVPFQEEILAFAEGQTRFESEISSPRLRGDPMECLVRVEIVRGYESTWGRVFVTVVDITERKRAEQAMRESEARYRSLFENAPTSQWEEDFSAVKTYIDSLRKSGVDDLRSHFQQYPDVVKHCASVVKILDINQATIDLYGASDENEILNGFGKLFSEEDYLSFQEELLTFSSGGTQFETEQSSLRLGGTRMECLVRVEIVRGFEATWGRVFVTIVDITERKRAERALRESEAKFRTFIEQSSEGITLIDEEGIIIEWNNARELTTGLKRDQVIGRYYWDVQDRLVPSDRQSPEGQQLRRQSILDALRIGKSPLFNHPIETEYSPLDGSRRFIQQVIFPIKTEKGFRIGSFSRDITEQKQVEAALQIGEARLRQAVRVGTIGIFDHDQVRNTFYWSPELREIFGLSSDEPASLDLYIALIHPDDRERVRQAVGKAHSPDSDGSFDLVHRITTRSGIVRWLSVRSRTFFEGEGSGRNPVRTIGAMSDITERKLAEEALRRSEEAEREQRVLAEALRDTAAALTSSLDPETVMSGILENLDRVVPYETASIMLVKADHAYPAYCRGWSEADETVFRAALFPLNTPNLREMTINRAPLMIPDTSQYPGWEPVIAAIRSYIGAPIQVHGNIIGFLNVDSSRPGFFTSQHAERLGVFANQAAIAMENAQLYEELRNYAHQLEVRVEQRTAQLKDAKEHVEAIISNSSDAIILADVNRGIQQTNPAFLALFDCDDVDYLGADIVSLAAPEDVARLRSTVRDTVTQDVTLRIELKALKNDGTVFDAEIGLSPVTGGGELTTVVCTLRDITARKLAERALRDSEERFRSYFELPLIGMVITTPDGDWLQVNDKLCEILGYPREELVARRWGQLIFAEDIAVDKANFDEMLAGKTDGYSIDKRYVRKDGKVIFASSTIRAVRHPNGELNYLVGLIQDISERKQLERELRQSLDKEKELNELKSRFVSMASHEFRTPLATIRAAADSLSAYRGRMNEQQINGRLYKIVDQVVHLTGIMDEVLTLSKMQAGKMDFMPIDMDLDDFLKDIIDEFQSRPDIKHLIQYTCKCENTTVKTDKVLMRKIVDNLLSNAIKYSPNAETVDVCLDCTDDSITFEIQDYGIGIPAADQSHLFDAYHRGQNVGNLAGTGLGLSIAKQSVELHRGTISFRSQIGEGTTFLVAIPRGHPQAPANAAVNA